MTQKDLFELGYKPAEILSSETVKPKSNFSFLEQTRFVLRLDQALAGTMALMVGMAVVYGLGVETGRRWERKSISVSRAAAPKIAGISAKLPAGEAQPAALPPVEIKKASSIAQDKSPKGVTNSGGELPLRTSEVETQAVEKPKGVYTIQMATYKEQSMAQKKVQALASQGLNGFWVPSGSFYLVCVNGFDKRQQATQSLTRLKSRGIVPKDAYVRMTPA